MIRKSLLCVVLMGAFSTMCLEGVGLTLIASAGAQTSDTATPREIVQHLQKGGYILYVLHATTDHSQSDLDLSDMRQCALQRNLSQQGKEETKLLKAALNKLNIIIGAVYTSPYCRCVDTAKIGFDDYIIDTELRATFYTDKDETRSLIAHLKSKLSEIPLPKTNTVLVGHTANLRDLTKIWPKPEGVVHVFKPLGIKGYHHIGHIEPSQWSSLAGL